MWTRAGALPRTRRLRRAVNAVAAAGVSAVLLGVLGFGYGTMGPGDLASDKFELRLGLLHTH